MSDCCKSVGSRTGKSAGEEPMVVSREEWRKAHEQFLKEEKALTRERDALNAKRRRLPMVEITKDYTFTGPEGEESLETLFDGRSQLIIYHFMFDPTWTEGCDGCSMMVDNMGHLAHLNARDTTLVLVSRAPLGKLQTFQERMGWGVPWYSSFSSAFNDDFGATNEHGETHGYSVFLKKDNKIYHTFSTWARGVEYLGSNWSFLDLTPYGRQEEWEDSPYDVNQTPTYTWWRHHDRYET
ncbi:hypothetical protein OBCHQ24_07045 [Oceanobacillus iheyensis]|nr:hypothetical protein OBCHQ24_07045 [Oceanobacillus iheyensis]